MNNPQNINDSILLKNQDKQIYIYIYTEENMLSGCVLSGCQGIGVTF